MNKWKWTANKIGDEGAKKISESLMINTTLTKLNLNSDDNIIKNIKIMKNRFLNIFILWIGNSISYETEKALGIW